jgi:hypothetical protein
MEALTADCDGRFRTTAEAGTTRAMNEVRKLRVTHVMKRKCKGMGMGFRTDAEGSASYDSASLVCKDR